MQKKGKLIPAHAEAQAITFMWMNYGAFMGNLHGATSSTSMTLQEFMETSIELLTRALSPLFFKK